MGNAPFAVGFPEAALFRELRLGGSYAVGYLIRPVLSALIGKLSAILFERTITEHRADGPPTLQYAALSFDANQQLLVTGLYGCIGPLVGTSVVSSNSSSADYHPTLQACIVSLFFVDKVGRRPIMVTSLGLLSASCGSSLDSDTDVRIC